MRGDILIVEKDAAIRALCAEALGDEGYATWTAHDAKTALASMRQHPPDLVLLDLHLPGNAAASLLAALQRSGVERPRVVAMTTTKFAEVVPARDITACLLKPFGLGDLLDCVAKHIHTASR